MNRFFKDSGNLLLVPILAVILVGLMSPAAEAQRRHPTTTPTLTPIPGPNGEVTKGTMVCLPKQKWLELVDWFNGLHAQNTKAQTDLSNALLSNKTTQTNLDRANTDLDNLKKEMAADQVCAKSPFTCGFKRLLHHIFWIAGAIVGLLILLIVINIFTGGALTGFFSIFGTIGKWIAALIPKPKPPAPPPPPPPVT